MAYKQIYITENTPSIKIDNLYVAAMVLATPLLKASISYIQLSYIEIQCSESFHETMEAIDMHFPIVVGTSKNFHGCLSEQN